MRKWLYNKNADATIFHGEEAINKALASGWVDSPAKFSDKEAIEAVIIPKQTRKRNQVAIENK